MPHYGVYPIHQPGSVQPALYPFIPQIPANPTSFQALFLRWFLRHSGFLPHWSSYSCLASRVPLARDNYSVAAASLKRACSPLLLRAYDDHQVQKRATGEDPSKMIFSRAAVLLVGAITVVYGDSLEKGNVAKRAIRPNPSNGHWIDAWASMPQLTEPANLPPAPFVCPPTWQQCYIC
jgi:hypothetical protein